MPDATNPQDGVRIHYEVEGQGPPLVLLHGFSLRLERWRDAGYTEELRGEFRLILLDARGHGQSDKPHDPESYTMDLLVTDVTSVLDALDVTQAHCWGYSMGGVIVFGMSAYAPTRIASLVVGGQHPYPNEPEAMNRRAEALGEGIEAYVAELEARSGRQLPEPLRSRALANDAEALAAATVAARDIRGLEEGLANVEQPTLVYAGDQDPAHDLAQRAAREMPSATFLSLEGLTHATAFARTDLVLPEVRKLLASAER